MDTEKGSSTTYSSDQYPRRGNERVLFSEEIVSESLSADILGDLPSSRESRTAVSLIERRSHRSLDDLLTIVDLAQTDAGWWLLADLLSAASEGREARDLVSALVRFAGCDPKEASETVHTRLLPRLLITGLGEYSVQRRESAGPAPVVAVESKADREYIGAVLLLMALVSKVRADGDPRSVSASATGTERNGDEDEWSSLTVSTNTGVESVDPVLVRAIARFGTVVERGRGAARRADRERSRGER